MNYEELLKKNTELSNENTKLKMMSNIQRDEYIDIYKRLKKYNDELVAKNNELLNLNILLKSEIISIKKEMFTPPLLRL